MYNPNRRILPSGWTMTSWAGPYPRRMGASPKLPKELSSEPSTLRRMSVVSKYPSPATISLPSGWSTEALGRMWLSREIDAVRRERRV